ncbi:MAG: disulfide bond formation protein B [Panacagrimonas sp.]
MRSYRFLALLGFLVCVAGLAFALYLQHFRGFEPCPMCIFQRVAMGGTAIALLLGALHAPVAWGRWVYAGLAAASSLIGAFIAGRHVWLQHLPADQVPACGPTLDYLLGMLPVSEVVQMVLRGDGNCAKIDAAWLGLALPTWTLVLFVGLTLFSLILPLLSARPKLR